MAIQGKLTIGGCDKANPQLESPLPHGLGFSGGPPGQAERSILKSSIQLQPAQRLSIELYMYATRHIIVEDTPLQAT
jgi:hypothetical protein